MYRLFRDLSPLFLAFTALFHLTRCNPVQVTFSNGLRDRESDNSNIILTSLDSLLKSWPQTYAPHGRAIVPATIKPGTLLYHSGLDPKGMDWFAFDPEHSYGFGVGGAIPFNQSILLYTYAATRTLRVVYFDGFSASKQSDGCMDLQNLLVYGKADGGRRYGEFERGRLLCEWGKQFGIEGFVREEATFELLWCDFEDGVQLLSANDIKLPSTEDPEDPPSDMAVPSSQEVPARRGPPGGPSGRPRVPSSPYYTQSKWSWYHAALWHVVAESRVTLYPAYLVSLYDPIYSSLHANNKLPVRQHRLLNISSEDQALFRAELEQALTAWNKDPRGEGSGVDWSSTAHAVVERNGDRIAEMRKLLDDVTAASNITEVVSQARLIAFALVMPYIDHGTIFSPNATADVRVSLLADVAKQCSLAFTGHIRAPSFRLTPQEQRLKGAIEGVLKKICTFSTNVFGESLNLLDALAGDTSGVERAAAAQALQVWRNNVKELMNWLGWSMWQRCPKACEWDELCYLPMWPLRINGDRPPRGPWEDPNNDNLDLEPRCAKREEFYTPYKY